VHLRIVVGWNLRRIFEKIASLVFEDPVKFLNSLQPFGLFLLRAALGLIFFTHGFPKLAHSNPGMQGLFVQHGLPAQFVFVAGVLETFGGLLLVLGLFARPAALLLAIEMSVAIAKVHLVHVMVVHDYEFPLALAVACFALATVGAGAASADHFLFGEGGSKRVRVPNLTRR
jgi:putative oxidoreductase